MATKGRKPKPTAMKLLEGNPGKRPINANEPVPLKGTVKCPDWLLPEAKKEWKRLAPSLEAMGVLTMADLTAFEGYCQAYARWREAEEFISQHGSIFKTPSGYIQQVPSGVYYPAESANYAELLLRIWIDPGDLIPHHCWWQRAGSGRPDGGTAGWAVAIKKAARRPPVIMN